MTTKKSSEEGRPAKPEKAARPKIRASHAAVGRREGAKEGKKPRPLAEGGGEAAKSGASPRRTRDASSARRAPPGSVKPGRAPSARKVPLSGPKRASKRPPVPETAPPGPSDKAREIAVAIATAGIDKKAIGIEILDVTGKVDYTDFLVVMTGRSDRHVHAIATGIEEAMRKKKIAPMSMEGLAAATWVLIDFGDVVVHVFQEEARMLYDIEGLWIDAGRVPLPPEGTGPAGPLGSPAAKAPPPDVR